jgi:hypothetical protein
MALVQSASQLLEKAVTVLGREPGRVAVSTAVYLLILRKLYRVYSNAQDKGLKKWATDHLVAFGRKWIPSIRAEVQKALDDFSVNIEKELLPDSLLDAEVRCFKPSNFHYKYRPSTASPPKACPKSD